MSDVERLREERQRLKKQYRGQYEYLAQLLFERDPIGINFGDNLDEYEPETGTILPRLSECTGPADLARVMHEEFVHWFGADTAGPLEPYLRIAEEAWPKLNGSP